MEHTEALELLDGVVARTGAGEQLEAVLQWTASTEVRAHQGSVEHFVSATEAGIGIRVIRDGRTGMAYSGALDPEAIDAVVAQARDNSRFSSADPNAGLAEPDGVEASSLETVDPGLVDVTPEEKIALALELDSRVLEADRIVGHEGADYGDATVVSAIASSTGIRSVETETVAQAAIWALAGDGNEVTSGFGLDSARGFAGLDASAVVAEAIARSTGLLGATKATSGRVTVVLEPYVTSQFLGVVAEMLSGEEVLRGRSPFAERIGETVASELFGLGDHPHAPDAPTAGAYDGEGLATREVSLVSNGVLRGFLHNAYSARCLGAEPTASAARSGYRGAPGVGPRVLTPMPGSLTAEELHREVSEAVVVTELSGLHSGVNPTSGDLSVGIEGYRLRGGERAEPVREVTIASSIQRMLTDVVAVGSDLRRFPWDASGVSLAVADVTLSGT